MKNIIFYLIAITFASCAGNNAHNKNVTQQDENKPGAIKKMISRTYYKVKFKDGKWVPEDTSDFHEQTYIYNKDGLPAEYYWDAEREKTYHIKETFYYKDGKFVDRVIYADTMKLNKTIEWENDRSYKEVFFDNDGNIINEYWYTLNNAQKPVIEKWFSVSGLTKTTHYKYDPANILIEEVDTLLGTPSRTTYKALTQDHLGNPLTTLATKEALDQPVTRKLIVKSYEYY